MPTDDERAAFEDLKQHLAVAGEPITPLREPDTEDRERRAIDFEVEWRGTMVGIEATSASQYIAEMKAADRLQNAVVDALHPFVEKHGLGKVTVQFVYDERPRNREIPGLVRRIVADVSALLAEGRASDVLPEAPPPLNLVAVTREGGPQDSVRGSSMPAPGYWVEGMVDEFVTGLISKKGDQGKDYPILWLLIYELTMTWSADDLAAGFQRHRTDLPENWRRAFYRDGPPSPRSTPRACRSEHAPDPALFYG